ncbi:MAG TPA: hypothetical protein VG963_06475, partial [Polyangiaceae bacterium]|nr:hypothetical protein [Polyangiaceae bacterium]
ATGAPDLGASLISARVHGRGASVHTDRGWAPLAEGTQQLQPGAELLLERKTTVDLERGNERARLETNGAYHVAPREGVLVAAMRGAVTAGGPGEVRIDVPGGSIVVPSDGRATVSLGAHGTWLDVQSRDVMVEANGQREQIRPGQRASIDGDGALSVQGRGLDHADVEVAVGESLVIHDPSPPTAVRFAFANRCHELGVLELSHGAKGEFAVGESAVALQVPRGMSHYRLSCGADRSQVVQSGTLTVLADDGSRKVAARAPVTKIIADGHRYTVLYQNRLPVISLSWPGAPSSDGLRLQHEFGSEKETLAVTGPEYTFPSGKLREGHHEFYFEGGGKVSRHTHVDIQFDNAAPTATLDGPGLVAAAPGQALTVSGIAVPGWDVLVAGQRPSKDAQGRFSAAVTWPADTRALAVRLSQADRGTHVYLRRARQP